MKKGLLILIAIGVCALQVSAQAQAFSSLPDSLNSENKTASAPATVAQPLAVTDLRAKLNEARNFLKSHANLVNGSTVALAVLDRDTSTIELVSVAKDSFLTKGAHLSVTAQSGRALNVEIVRANGVNTAVRVNDATTGKELTPLTVAFPIVKSGSITEVA